MRSRVGTSAVINHVRTLAAREGVTLDRPHRPQTADRSTPITNDDTPQMYTDSDNTGCPTVPMTRTIETDTDARRENLEELVWSHRTEEPTGERR